MILAGTELGAGPPVALLHGLFGAAANFGTVQKRLAERFRVIALDLRNHGNSPHAPHMSYPTMAEDVLETLRARSALPCALVGHSMGALVALDAAGRYPDKVRALGLCGVATEMPVHPEMLESAKAGTLKVQELMTFWGIGNALHKGGMVSPGLWLRAESLAVLSANKPGVIHTDLAACNVYKDALVRASEVKCPTAFVLGDGDLMTPAAKARPLAAAIAGARVVVIANSGHFMIVERPDETLEALKDCV